MNDTQLAKEVAMTLEKAGVQFPVDVWRHDMVYPENTILVFVGETYRSRLDHKSHASLTPAECADRYQRVKITTEGVESNDVYKPWELREEGYERGEIVEHKGKHYISWHFGKNRWAPGIYGWEEC